MSTNTFQGDKKAPMKTLLAGIEKWFVDSNVKRFPQWVHGYQLTLMTLLWSVALVGFGFMAAYDVRWLWGSSLVLVLQWFTDCFDGALGRFRNFGIPKWGFYMDHFLDYIFLCSIVLGYGWLMTPESQARLFLLVPILGGFMVSAFLSFGATNQFKITHLGFGPTEGRLLFIGLNAFIMCFGIEFLEKALVPIIFSTLGLLSIIVFRTQKKIWMAERPGA